MNLRLLYYCPKCKEYHLTFGACSQCQTLMETVDIWQDGRLTVGDIGSVLAMEGSKLTINLYPMPVNHHGQQCVYIPRTCQEGYCEDCMIAQEQKSQRRL
jgi:hypothetical protein